MNDETLPFLSSHGIVYAHEGECVSLTYGKPRKKPCHTPVMFGGWSMTITTLCDHDIGVVVSDEGHTLIFEVSEDEQNG